MTEALEPLPGGGILYDPSQLRKPSREIFDAAAWRQRATVSQAARGRGAVSFIRDAERRWVLRHYRRGGLVQRLIKDRYVWTGANNTRSFREWRLLAEMQRLGLPVPVAVAACYEREGWLYRADIITQEITGARPLSMVITEEALDGAAWGKIGATIARFHGLGIRHADLNAHNILLANDRWYVLDFDRARRCERGAWEARVLARLLRSLTKLKRENVQLRFNDSDWSALLAAYDAALNERADKG